MRQQNRAAAGRFAVITHRDSDFRLAVFRLVTAGALGMFLFVVVRGLLLEGGFPTVDQAVVVILAAILALSKKHPGWVKPLSWLSLLVFIVSIFDGLWADRLVSCPVTPTIVLLPLLVLYGAIMGDIFISAASLLFVLGVHAASWLRFEPQGRHEVFVLTNLVLLSVLTGLVSFAAWLRYRRLAQALGRKSQELEAELERTQRLATVIFHDIRNPLMALSGSIELASSRGIRDGDLEGMGRMTARIGEVIQSASEIESSAGARIELKPVSVRRVFGDLEEVFGPGLAEKGLKFILSDPENAVLSTNAPLLRNSVLGNILSNALKFSPRGSRIEVTAVPEGSSVRIEMRDHGGGFPPGAIRAGSSLPLMTPSEGTSGEKGSGHGLQIASYYAGLLGGRIELRNIEGGGASASIILPRADPGDGG